MWGKAVSVSGVVGGGGGGLKVCAGQVQCVAICLPRVVSTYYLLVGPVTIFAKRSNDAIHCLY